MEFREGGGRQMKDHLIVGTDSRGRLSLQMCRIFVKNRGGNRRGAFHMLPIKRADTESDPASGRKRKEWDNIPLLI